MPVEVRDLVITHCEEVAHGTTNGKPWHLWKVKANRADTGAPVEQPLRSFVELAKGERAEFKVEPREDDQHGKTYLLTPKRESQRVLKQRTDRLEERVEELETQVAKLINLLQAAGAPLTATDLPE